VSALNNANFGRVQSDSVGPDSIGPRIVQLALKLVF
jgi:hypothetical protein